MKDRLIYMLASMPAEYEDDIEAIADHLLYSGVIMPPCCEGDIVYYRTYENNGGTDLGIQPHEVIGIKTIVRTKGADIPIEAFGKDVYMSRQEAQNAVEMIE